MKIITRNQIDKIYTQKVQELLAQPNAVLSPETASGHQGELGKVDVKIKNRLYRIMLEKVTFYTDDMKELGFSIEDIEKLWNLEGIRFQVREYKIAKWDKLKNLSKDEINEYICAGSTVWNDKGRIIFNQNFISIDNLSSKTFVATAEEYKEMKNLRKDRAEKRYAEYNARENKNKVEITPLLQKIAFKQALKHIEEHGMKGFVRSIHPENLVKVEKYEQSWTRYNYNKSYDEEGYKTRYTSKFYRFYFKNNAGKQMIFSLGCRDKYGEIVD